MDRTHLLDQQLRGVRDRDARYRAAFPTTLTPALVRQHPALFTDLRVEAVGRDHESFEEELGRAITDQTGVSAARWVKQAG